MSHPVDYDQVAGGYDRRYTETDFDGIEQAVLQFVGAPSRSRVLEVGCGTGHWLAILDRHGFSVTGVDSSERMLDLAKARVPRATLKRGQAHLLPCADQSFDRLICVNAIHHFERKSEFLSEARRVLAARGGAMIVGLDPSRGADRWSVYDYFEGSLDADRRRYPSTSQVEEWMSGVGFLGCRTEVVYRLRRNFPAREALTSGLLHQATVSQLSLLSTAAYEQGLDRIRQAVREPEARGEDLFLIVDLRFYATIGWTAS